MHRSNMIRRAASAAIASLVLAPCLSLAAPARSAGLRLPEQTIVAHRAFGAERLAAKPVPDHAPKTGLIVASSMFLVATPFDSAVTLVAAMTRLQQPQPVTASCGGAWRVHFAVQLERPSGEETLELEFYDVSISAPAEGRTRMFFSEIATHRGDTTIFVNDFVIETDLGFAAGHEYEVSVRRPDGSAGPRALAKGRLTLGD